MTEAPEMRRSLNARISALPDLPRPSVRLRPVREPCRASHSWAKLLEWRSGWHGLWTGKGRRVVVFLYRLLQSTYVIDFDSHRTLQPSCFQYVLDSTFTISDHILNMKEFEKRIGDDVRCVFQLTMKAGGNVRGVPLRMVSADKITTPTPYATNTSKKKAEKDAAFPFSEGDSCDNTSKKKAEKDVAFSEGDSCEEVGEEEVASDMEDDVIDVDTDSDKKSFDESGNSLSEASISSDDGPAKGGPGPAIGGPAPATGPASGGPAPPPGPASGGPGRYGHSGPNIWDNGYFL